AAMVAWAPSGIDAATNASTDGSARFFLPSAVSPREMAVTDAMICAPRRASAAGSSSSADKSFDDATAAPARPSTRAVVWGDRGPAAWASAAHKGPASMTSRGAAWFMDGVWGGTAPAGKVRDDPLDRMRRARP